MLCDLICFVCLWVRVCNVIHVLVRCVCDLLCDVAWSVCCDIVCFVCDVVRVVVCFFCVCFVVVCVCV